jgi:prophage regulatory protein
MAFFYGCHEGRLHPFSHRLTTSLGVFIAATSPVQPGQDYFPRGKTVAEQLSQLNSVKLEILKRREVERLTGLSKSSIYSRVAAGLLPRPLSLGGQSVGWYRHEIEAYLAQLPRARAGERAAAVAQ